MSSSFKKTSDNQRWKRNGWGTHKKVVQYMNWSLKINMQQLEKERKKPWRSICTSSQKRLKSYKNEEPTPCLQQLEGDKKILIIQNPNIL